MMIVVIVMIVNREWVYYPKKKGTLLSPNLEGLKRNIVHSTKTHLGVHCFQYLCYEHDLQIVLNSVKRVATLEF